MLKWVSVVFLMFLLPLWPFPELVVPALGFEEPRNKQSRATSIDSPRSVTVDKDGNLYVADQSQHRVLRLDPSGRLSVVAGIGKEGFGGDGGPARQASLTQPRGVTLDSDGNIFVADWGNHRIRRVDAKTGTISTVAGNGTQAFSGDGGPASQASLSRPGGVAVDQFGNLFIADMWNHRVRRVDAATGVITTVAGNGSREYGGDGGPAVDAGLGLIPDIALDKSGNLYIADNNNERVRRVDVTTHVITTVAGDGSQCYRGDGNLANSTGLPVPSAVAVGANYDLFIADTFRNTIHRVDSASGIMTTVAGNGLRRFAGDGGPAIEASLAAPAGIALDSSGNLYVADTSNHRVRRVDVQTGVITTVVGDENPGFLGDLIATDDEMKPFAPFFLDFSEYVNRFKIIKQHKISPEYSVTMIEGSAAHEDVLCQGEKIEYSKRAADGIFIMSDAGKKLALVLDVFRGPWRSGLKILQADERTLIASKQDETYGGESERVKYFYDLPSRKLINKISYHAMDVHPCIVFKGGLYCLATDDGKRTILLHLSAGGADPAHGLSIIQEIEGEKIPLLFAAREEAGKLVLKGENRRVLYSKGGWAVRFDPAHEELRNNPYTKWFPELGAIQTRGELLRFEEATLRVESPDGSLRRLILGGPVPAADGKAGIHEFTPEGRVFHSLPQPDYEKFQRYRTRRVRDGYSREHTTLELGIGPFQLVRNKLWFGLSFYDGEGTSGIGGFGWFDISARQFRIHHYHEIAAWSASAILIENDAIWLGLMRRPEGSPYSGGLVRFDRREGTFQRYEIPALINQIQRLGGVLYLATSEGIYILDGPHLTHVDFTLDVQGRYSVRLRPVPTSPPR